MKKDIKKHDSVIFAEKNIKQISCYVLSYLAVEVIQFASRKSQTNAISSKGAQQKQNNDSPVRYHIATKSSEEQIGLQIAPLGRVTLSHLCAM